MQYGVYGVCRGVEPLDPGILRMSLKIPILPPSWQERNHRSDPPDAAGFNTLLEFISKGNVLVEWRGRRRR